MDLFYQIFISLFLSVFLLLSKLNFVRDFVFDKWLTILSCFYSLKGGDNRSFSKIDDNMSGCDIFSPYKEHKGEYYTVEKLKDPIRVFPLVLSSGPISEMVRSNMLSKSLSYSEACGFDNCVVNYLKYLTFGLEINILSSKVKVESKVINGLIHTYFMIRTDKGCLISKKLKVMDLSDSYNIYSLLNEISEIKLPIVGCFGNDFYKEGLCLDFLLDSPNKLILVKHKSENGFKIHGKVNIRRKRRRHDDEANSSLSQAPKQVMFGKLMPSNEIIGENNSGLSFFSFIKEFLLEYLRLNEMIFIFVVFNFLFLLSGGNKLSELINLLLLCFTLVGEFRVRFILGLGLPEKAGEFIFMILYLLFGENYGFCGLNNFNCERAKKFFITKKAKSLPFKNEFKVSQVDYDIRSLDFKEGCEEFEFSKCSVSINKNGENTYKIIETTKGLFPLEKKFEVELTIEEINLFHFMLKEIENRRSSGVVNSGYTIASKTVYHLCSIKEMIDIVKSSGGVLYELEFAGCSGNEFFGRVGVQIDEEDFEICKLNGWGDDSFHRESLAAIKYYCEKFWEGTGNEKGADYYLNLPVKSQTLKRSWFEGSSNKKLKMFLSGASEMVFTFFKISYYKIEKCNRSKSLIETLELVKEQGFTLNVTETKKEKESRLDKIYLCEVNGDPTRDEVDPNVKPCEPSDGESEDSVVNEFMEEILCKIQEFEEKRFKKVGDDGVLKIRETEKRETFKMWLTRKGLVPQGNRKEKKVMEGEWFKEWRSQITDEEFDELKTSPYSYVKPLENTIVLEAAELCTLSGRIKDIRLYFKEAEEGIVYTKNKFKVMATDKNECNRNKGGKDEVGYELMCGRSPMGSSIEVIDNSFAFKLDELKSKFKNQKLRKGNERSRGGKHKNKSENKKSPTESDYVYFKRSRMKTPLIVRWNNFCKKFTAKMNKLRSKNEFKGQANVFITGTLASDAGTTSKYYKVASCKVNNRINEIIAKKEENKIDKKPNSQEVKVIPKYEQLCNRIRKINRLLQ